MIRFFAPLAFLCFLAATVEYAQPFFSNQNQYFAHAVPHTQIAQDWLLTTTDPYPVFTILGEWLITASRTVGPLIASYLANLVALAAIFLFARKLKPSNKETHGIAPYLATLLVASTLISVPIDASIFKYSFFDGFGGQYIISKPSYFQPSVAGGVLLLALYLWIFRVERDRVSWPAFTSASALTCLACILHPTYLIAAAIGLGLLALVRFVVEQRNRFFHYLAVGLLIVAVILLLNPSVLDIGSADAGYAAALNRFAYERIPHHTLWRHWPLIDVILLFVAAGGAWVANRVYDEKLLGLWLALALGVSVLSAIVLPLLPSPKFVLMFPWRISVCLVPIGATILARWAADRILHWWPVRKSHVALVTCLLASWGVTQTVLHWDKMDKDPAVMLLRSARPAGVGITPPENEFIRLNVPAPIYVDWKSPPYASDDLIAWWRRLDQVQALYRDLKSFCSAKFEQRIDWFIVPTSADPLGCPDQWIKGQGNDEWQIYLRSKPADSASPVSSG